jgi:hypothetical protein
MGILDQVQNPGQPEAFRLPSLALPSMAIPKAGSTKPPDLRQAGRLQSRSRHLVETVRAIDAQLDPTALNGFLRWIHQTYDLADIGDLLGLFSRCYLGPPFIDHRLDLGQQILEHYKPQDTVPLGYGGARRLAVDPSYEYIEVYRDGTLVPVHPDGTVGPTQSDQA